MDLLYLLCGDARYSVRLAGWLQPTNSPVQREIAGPTVDGAGRQSFRGSARQESAAGARGVIV